MYKMQTKKFFLFLLFGMIKADSIVVEMKNENVEFEITKMLGSGSFGIVFKGIYTAFPDSEEVEAAFKIAIGADGEQQLNNEVDVYVHLNATAASDISKRKEASDAGIPILYAIGTINECKLDQIEHDVNLIERLDGRQVLIMEFAGNDLFTELIAWHCVSEICY